MFRCENPFSEKIRSFEMRHDQPFNIDNIQIEELIDSYEIGRKKLYNQMESLKEVRVNMNLVHRLAIQLLGTESRKEQMMDPHI